MDSTHDTFAALSTPIGASAIAIIRANGPLVPILIKNIFQNETPIPRQFYAANYQSISSENIDYCSFVYLKSPNSYTGDDILEINCHGNPLIIEKILEDLQARDCRLAYPGEFTRRAYENKKLNLTQAEAVRDLIHAKNERTLLLAKKQLEGSLSTYIQDITQSLITNLAEIEAYIDFSDEDLPKNERHYHVKIEQIKKLLQNLLQTHTRTQFIQQGIKTAIIGAPNAGKSTLLNTLLGHQRAIVSPHAGTTRDYIIADLQLNHYHLKLIDTAGLRYTNNDIEAQGIQKTIQQSAEADFNIWVLDHNAPWPYIEPIIYDRLKHDNTLLVINKIDLPKNPEFNIPHKFSTYEIIYNSIESPVHKNELELKLSNCIEKYFIPQSTDDFLINSRHKLNLQNAIQALESGLNNSSSIEFIASDIRMAIYALEELIGHVDNEHILDHLFNTFCIGK